MEPNLREAAHEGEHEERAKIRLAKMEEIRKAWDDLFFILAGEEVFKKSHEFRDYASFEESLRQTLEEVGDNQRQKGSQTTDNHMKTPRDLLDQGGKLARLDYTPPQHGKELAVDLLQLQEYYRSIFSPIHGDDP